MGELIRLKNVSKVFKTPRKRMTLFRILKAGVGNGLYREVCALNDIDLTVHSGEMLGLTGPNGCGKTTLLKLVAGIYRASAGQVNISGTTAAFMQLGAGMDSDLTVEENIYLFGTIMGLSERKIKQKFSEIVKFAELENFVYFRLIDLSSGMRQRLAFSIAIQTETDVLILDEILSSSDKAFSEKCSAYFQTFKKSGRTLLFSSHDENYLKKFTDRVIYMNQGRIV